MNDQLKLKTSVAHWWWLLVVLWAFLAGPGAVVVSLEYRNLASVGISLLIPAVLFCLFLWVGPLFDYLVFPQVVPPRPALCVRARILLNGLIQPELLGWVIWVAGTIVAVSSSLAREQSCVYLAILNSASPDFARASVIGLIVIFFTQMLGRYQSTADKLQYAAAEAHEAAKSSQKAIEAGTKALPELRDVTERSLAAFQTVHADQTTHEFRQKITDLLSDEAHVPANLVGVVSGLSEQIAAHIHRLYDELSASAHDPFQYLTFATLYHSYLETECLTFVPSAGAGKGSCRFATRFVHYAQAVRRIVDLLHVLDKDRYQYYTILNVRPKHFFNLRGKSVDPEWSEFQDFCRWHHTDCIPYTRLFLANYEEEPKTEQFPKRQDVIDDLNAKILCGGDELPVLWNTVGGTSQLDERIQKCATDLDLMAPAYIIALADDNRLEKVVQEVKNPDLKTRTLSDVLPEYHNPTIPPRLLTFDDSNHIEDFFGEHLPRDLFAVWDNNPANPGWCLLIGSFASSEDATAVTLVFATRDGRDVLEGLTWAKLAKKLDLLFLERNRNILKEIGIALRGLDGKETDR